MGEHFQFAGVAQHLFQTTDMIIVAMTEDHPTEFGQRQTKHLNVVDNAQTLSGIEQIMFVVNFQPAWEAVLADGRNRPSDTVFT